jgi:hypothetical protein
MAQVHVRAADAPRKTASRADLVRTAATVAALALALGVAACGSARRIKSTDANSATKVQQETAVHRAAAERAAATLLGVLRLPAGAVASSADPEASGSTLESSSPSTSASGGAGVGSSPDTIDLHHWWVVPGDPSQVLTELQSGVPSTLQSSGTSSYSSTTEIGASTTSETSASESFSGLPVPGVIASQALVVDVAPATAGHTAVRVDAQVVWLPPGIQF